MKVELWQITKNPVQHIVRCARVSHASESKGPESDAKLVKKLIELGHDSVLEFADATFFIDGISRACLAQLTRHRIGVSFCVESQRYVDQDDASWIIPPSVMYLLNRGTCLVRAETCGKIESMMDDVNDFYKFLLRRGIPQEDARFFLPLATSARLTMKANFRALRHIISLRSSKQAQWEIRELACKLHGLMINEAAPCFEDLDVS